MSAKELNLGYQYTHNKNGVDISFYQEHGIYFVVGFINYNESFTGIYQPFETFIEGKKYFNSLKA